MRDKICGRKRGEKPSSSKRNIYIKLWLKFVDTTIGKKRGRVSGPSFSERRAEISLLCHPILLIIEAAARGLLPRCCRHRQATDRPIDARQSPVHTTVSQMCPSSTVHVPFFTQTFSASACMSCTSSPMLSLLYCSLSCFLELLYIYYIYHLVIHVYICTYTFWLDFSRAV